MPITIERRPNYTGKMVRVPTGKPGQFIQMPEDEAIKRGLLPAPTPEPAPQHKKRTPVRNK